MAQAALRDASWLSRPNTTSVKRYHVFHPTQRTALCGLQAILCVENAIDAEEVPQALRCQRPGCKQGWPEEAP